MRSHIQDYCSLTSPFDIAAASRPLGGPASVPGTGQGPQGSNTAPTGLFNAILAGLGGNTKAPVAEGTDPGNVAFNTEQNWLNKGSSDPNLSLLAQSLEIAQGNANTTLLPGTETMLDPALARVNSEAVLLGAPTQTSGQAALLAGTLATGTNANSLTLASAPLPATMPAGLRSANATLTTIAPTPVETATLQNTPAQSGAELPKAPASNQPQITTASEMLHLDSSLKLQAGPTLEFVATSATRGSLPPGTGGPAPTLDTLTLNALVAQNSKPGAPGTPATQPVQPDLAAALQRQLTPEGQRPQLGGNATAQKPADGLLPNALSLAPGSTAPVPTITPAALIGAQAELMGTTSDPALTAQTLGQSATPLSQTLVANGTPASFTSTLQNAYQQAQINLPNMAVEIARNFAAGNNRFQIRMDPPELGRIDVRLNIDENGALRARLSVERPETLDLLQRDARALERALAEAGFEGTRTNLEFSLKQNPFAGDGTNDNQSAPNNSEAPDANEASDQSADIVTALYRGSVSPGGLNMWA